MTHIPHIVIFDLYVGGHRGQHARNLILFWRDHKLPGRLSFVVPPAFFETHEDVHLLIEETPGVHAVPIEERLDLSDDGQLALLRSDLLHGRILHTYLTRLRPDHAVAMFFDHIQFSLATGLRFPFPVTLSGIYFRPSFHYGQIGTARLSLRERAQQLRKRLVLKAALRNPHFTHLFCLDPYAVPHITALSRQAQAVVLPDGIEPLPAYPPRDVLRTTWGVHNERRVLLFFGSIAERKGIYETLNALLLLPDTLQEQIALVLIGRTRAGEKNQVDAALERLRQASQVQVIVEARFVEEEEIQGFFEASDLALLPYQRHVGSSGVLVRAAHAGVPVLGSDYGTVGEHLRQRHLGLAVDTTSPEAIAAGIAQWLEHPDTFPFNPRDAQRFAADNTAEQYAATIFSHIATYPALSHAP